MAVVLALLAQSAALAAAQAGGGRRAADPEAPSWMHAWSPLAPLADRVRELPAAPALPRLLSAPAPRVGLFWTAGVAAGLPADVETSRARLAAGLTGDAGTYRRPLDAYDIGVRQLSALGWRPLGEASAVAGRVLADESTAGDAGFAGTAAPYASAPLFPTDTTSPEARRVRARLEGAYGWSRGGWGLGVAAGIEVHDYRSVASRFPRIGRASVPGAALSASRELFDGRMRVALYGRWKGGAEQVVYVPEPAGGVVYQLEGYGEPALRQVSLGAYIRRIEREAFTGGAAASGHVLGARWAAFVERGTREDRHFSELRNTPETDDWTADAWAAGGALQRGFLSDDVLATARIRYDRIEGAATRHDLEGDIFRAWDTALSSALELRYAPEGSGWSAAVAGSLDRDRRLANDYLTEVGSEIVRWAPGGALEVARRVTDHLDLSVGVSAAAHSATATIPDADALGPVFQRVIAPELALYATSATAFAAAATAAYRFGDERRFVLGIVRETVSPGEAAVPGFTPAGERTMWRVQGSLVLGR